MNRLLLALLLCSCAARAEKRANEYWKFSAASFEEAFKALDVEYTNPQPVARTERLDEQQRRDYYVVSIDPNDPMNSSENRFVKDKDGKIYALRVEPEVIAYTKRTYRSCPPTGSPAQKMTYFLLYQNISGEKILAYQTKVVHTRYKPKKPCLAPPSMPQSPEAMPMPETESKEAPLFILQRP